MNETESTFAQPFYVKMMSLNALRTADDSGPTLSPPAVQSR